MMWACTGLWLQLVVGCATVKPKQRAPITAACPKTNEGTTDVNVYVKQVNIISALATFQQFGK